MEARKIKFGAIIVLLLFFVVFLFFDFVFAANQYDVVVNEIAWMGTENSASDEWIELYNNTENEIDLNGWVLEAVDGSPKILLKEKIAAKSFYLLERTDDTSVSDISASQIYTGGLVDSGESLFLKNSDGEIIDTVDCSSGWFVGDSKNEKSMERIDSLFSGNDAANWHTSVDGGTPKAANSLSEVNEDQNIENQSAQSEQEDLEEPVEVESSLPIASSINNFLKANAGSNAEIFVGQKLLFDANFSEGISGETKYLWNFGDGFTSKEQKIYHSYDFPGEYVSSLKITQDNFSDTAIRMVKVLDSSVIISEFMPDAAGKDDNEWIELYNKSESMADVSGWQLDDGDKGSSPFSIPENTFLMPKSYLVFSKEATKLNLNNSDDSVRLLQKDSIVDAVQYAETYEGYSLNRTASDEAVWSEFVTPGVRNVVFKKNSESVSALNNFSAKAVEISSVASKKGQDNVVLKEKEIFDNFTIINKAQAQEIQNASLPKVDINKYSDENKVQTETQINSLDAKSNAAMLVAGNSNISKNVNTNEAKKNNSLLIITFCVGALGAFAIGYIDRLMKR